VVKKEGGNNRERRRSIGGIEFERIGASQYGKYNSQRGILGQLLLPQQAT